jgi:hypothetical protein
MQAGINSLTPFRGFFSRTLSKRLSFPFNATSICAMPPRLLTVPSQLDVAGFLETTCQVNCPQPGHFNRRRGLPAAFQRIPPMPRPSGNGSTDRCTSTRGTRLPLISPRHLARPPAGISGWTTSTHPIFLRLQSAIRFENWAGSWNSSQSWHDFARLHRVSHEEEVVVVRQTAV